ncbi:MAG: prenyltransferase/squalene oxidase repeat-containing protein [Planctomycetota bacterium]
MAETTNNSLPFQNEDQLQEETLFMLFVDWVRTELVWYAGSFSFHLLALSVLLLLPNFGGGNNPGDSPELVSKAEEADKKDLDKFENFDVGEIKDTPPVDLNVDLLQPLTEVALKAEHYDECKVFEQRSKGTVRGMTEVGSTGGGAFDFGPGPRVAGALSITPGSGGDPGFGGIGDISGRKLRKGPDVTRVSERAVTAALIWLAKHQMSDGSWSLQNFARQCKDKSCTGTGGVSADAGATAMGLLPFLGSGQTHRSKGPYKEHVLRGVQWLVRHQQPDGNLAKGAQQMMYSHGLATIALSEAYGLTGDKQVGIAAQGAVNFILAAQNTADGGWRYNPKDAGDTSVVGWQLMALKSAHMAGLNVGGSAFSDTGKWLDLVAVHDGAEYSYQPGGGPSPTMTSVGLLCRQYLGTKRNNPMLIGGMDYLLKHLPDKDFSNIYYWYYATQVMHNMRGSEWDTWNHKMRELLVTTQIRSVDECANGSWAPEKDAWGRSGGRVMQTSLSALTLEIYYRYLPLFKAETDSGEGEGAGASASLFHTSFGPHPACLNGK